MTSLIDKKEQGQPPPIDNYWLNKKGAGISKVRTTATCVLSSAETLAASSNTPFPITVLTTDVAGKVPIILAELTVQLNIEARIDLSEPATEIRNIDNRLRVTKCQLIENTNVLFIEGLIGKKIYYMIKKTANMDGNCESMKHCSVDVPFKCATPVAFNGCEPAPVIPATATVLENSPYFSQISTEYFNQKSYCELVSSTIVDFAEYAKPVRKNVSQYKSCEDKMAISIAVRLLQGFQVAIPAQH